MSRQDLPCNLDAERFVLGSVLVDDSNFPAVAARLETRDLSLEKHRRIFLRMKEIAERGDRIDRVTLVNELQAKAQLESVDGLGYIISLDDGMPAGMNLDSYLRILRDKSIRRQIIGIGQQCQDLAYTDETVEDILSSASTNLMSVAAEMPTKGPETVQSILENLEGGLDGLIRRASGAGGTATGFSKLDEDTGGLHPGELTVLGARPGVGKSAFAMNLAAAVARSGGRVPVFSLEMSKESLLLRLICGQARLGAQRLRSTAFSREERQRFLTAAMDLAEWPIYIDDTSGLSVLDLHSKIRKLRSDAGDIACIIIDYLQLMTSEDRYSGQRVLEVSQMTRQLKLMTKEFEVPIIVLSQLTRNSDKNAANGFRPQLSDLRESGSIEQDADNVWFLFREALFKPDRKDLENKAELIIAKQRNGPTGTIPLIFLKEYTRFENPVSDADYETEELP